MKKLLLVAALAPAMFPKIGSACSCFGNNSYCETLAPGWFNPDATALVVKLSTYHYGITVKVVQTFGGTSLPNDTLTVWGDNGALCRVYLDGIPDGDTVIFGLNETDFAGNFITAGYPPDLEQPGHYMVSVCGVYALNYENGLVSGWITAPTMQTMTLQDFETMVNACTIGVGVEEQQMTDPLLVRYVDGVPSIEMLDIGNTAVLEVVDVQGRSVLSRPWDGSPFRFDGWACGGYTVAVRSDGKLTVEKLVIR